MMKIDPALVEAQKNSSSGQRGLSSWGLATSRVSRPMWRMFRDLSGYIRGTQASVALAETDREEGTNRGRRTRLHQ
jgi:hypothetical protein